MPHLPNEIWLFIATYCEPKDLWLSIRPVNRQLRQCAEQYIKREVLPQTKLILPVVIPTYDVRIPIRGKVVFNPLVASLTAKQASEFGTVIYRLDDTEPDYYRPHFLTRWATMQDRETGHLDERRIRWEFDLGTQRRPINLYRPIAVKHECKAGETWISFDWRYMLTTYFRA
jgi:hypothetical protein